MTLQGVWASKLEFMSILQIHQKFGSTEGLGFEVGINVHSTNLAKLFGSTRGLGLDIKFYFHSTNLATFLAQQGVWAWKLNFILILQIYQHFWLGLGFELEFMSILQIYQNFWVYRGSWLRSWNLCPFYKSSNIFGPTRGLGLEIKFNFHSTNLATFLALQGVWA